MSLQSLKAKLAVFLPAVAASLILLGCGGGDSESVFIDRPVASFLIDSLNQPSLTFTVNPGETTGSAVQLDRIARQDIWVRLVSVSRSQNALLLPPAVRISAGQQATVFPITAQNNALAGERVEIRIVTDPEYTVGSPSVIFVDVGTPVVEQNPNTAGTETLGSALLRLDGPDIRVQPGEGFFYNVQRNQCGTSATVPLIATGDVNCFSVPDSVTLSAGACTASFSGVAGQCDAGSIDISVLPPPGYVLDSDIGIIVLGSGLASGEISSDRPLGEGGTVRVTIAN